MQQVSIFSQRIIARHHLPTDEQVNPAIHIKVRRFYARLACIIYRNSEGINRKISLTVIHIKPILVSLRPI